MSRTILVVEDNKDLAHLLEMHLRDLSYNVELAFDGDHGLAKAETEKYDLIILDLMLPGLDGFQVCRRLRAEFRTRHLPILMLSAKAQEIDKATGLKVGADDYLTKPADPSELVARVQNLLAQESTANAKAIAFLGSNGPEGVT